MKLYAGLAVVFVAGALAAGCKGRFHLPGDARFVTAVAVSPTFGCARMKDGSARCWGANEAGELGDGTRDARPESVQVVGVPKIAVIATGERHACALGADATVTCWGAGEAPGPRATGATAVAVGGRHACAIVGGGAVRCWGADDAGQVTHAAEVTGARAIAAHGDATCVIDAGRRVACWGRVPGRSPSDTALARIEALADVVDLSLGDAHACAVHAWGGVSCWGANDEGELGDGTFTDRARPVDVVGLVGVKKVAVGRRHSCALLGSGTVQCWGANGASQLADGTKAHRATPALVQGAFEVLGIAASGDASCVVFGDGSVRCWGGLPLPKTPTMPVTVPTEVRW